MTSLPPSVFPVYSLESNLAFWGLFLFLLQAIEKESDFRDFTAPHLYSDLDLPFTGEPGGVITAPGSFEGRHALGQQQCQI